MISSNVKWISDIDQLTYEQLRVEFMRFSPTYQLIHGWHDAPTSVLHEYLKAMNGSISLNVRRGIYPARTKELQARQKRYLEGLHEEAELTYFSYEDINMPYEKWWDWRGHLIFDSVTNQAAIRDLGTIDVSSMEETSKEVKNAMKQLAKDRSSRLHMLISVPMYMSYKDATQQISKLLKSNLLDFSTQARTRKKLHGKRHHEKPLLKKLKLLMYKCMYPDANLIELGIKANISPSNERILQSDQFDDEKKAAARRAIGLSASRALLAAEYIAERAARDKFPDSRPTPSLGIDWKASRKNLLKAWPTLKG